jgi:hypothetical protein
MVADQSLKMGKQVKGKFQQLFKGISEADILEAARQVKFDQSKRAEKAKAEAQLRQEEQRRVKIEYERKKSIWGRYHALHAVDIPHTTLDLVGKVVPTTYETHSYGETVTHEGELTVENLGQTLYAFFGRDQRVRVTIELLKPDFPEPEV